jgi:hypothetical protein
MFSDNHYCDQHVAGMVPMPEGVEQVLIERSPAVLYNPPYVGVRGWVGIELRSVKAADRATAVRDHRGCVRGPRSRPVAPRWDSDEGQVGVQTSDI